MTVFNIRTWINALQANPIRMLTQMQAVDEETLMEFRESTLNRTVGVNRFIAMHNGTGNDEFLRGLALGLTFGLSADDNMKQKEVATDLQTIIGMLTAKNINVFTGKTVRDEETGGSPSDAASNN